MRPLALNIGDHMRDVTLEVKIAGLRRFRFRVWIASQLLRLVAMVLGCKIDIEIDLKEGRW